MKKLILKYSVLITVILALFVGISICFADTIEKVSNTEYKVITKVETVEAVKTIAGNKYEITQIEERKAIMTGNYEAAIAELDKRIAKLLEENKQAEVSGVVEVAKDTVEIKVTVEPVVE